MVKKKQSALEKARSALKKAEHVGTPTSIKNRLKQANSKKARSK